MLNPVDYMIRQTGMTRAEFTAKHGFGKNILTRLTQGRLQSVTGRISAALWGEWQERGLDQDEFDEIYKTLDVDLAYQRWVHNRRLLNKVRLPAASSILQVKGSPFHQVVATIGSVSKTAQVLCVADVSVQRYADGRIKTMPDAIREALTDMSWPYTAKLEAAQTRWQEKANA